MKWYHLNLINCNETVDKYVNTSDLRNDWRIEEIRSNKADVKKRDERIREKRKGRKRRRDEGPQYRILSSHSRSLGLHWELNEISNTWNEVSNILRLKYLQTTYLIDECTHKNKRRQLIGVQWIELQSIVVK